MRHMTIEVLTVWDLEDLHYIAEEVLIRLRHDLYWYDDEGEDVFSGLTGKEREQAILHALARQEELGDRHYLDFQGNRELQRLTFHDALEMPLETIREKYLDYVLPKARNILRKGTLVYGVTVSDEVPDRYLDDLLALRWRENRKLWTMQWDHQKRRMGRKNHRDYFDRRYPPEF